LIFLAEERAGRPALIPGLAAVTFGRPGFFADATLAVGEMPPWSEQLPGIPL
jgi:hypothetical protein